MLITSRLVILSLSARRLGQLLLPSNVIYACYIAQWYYYWIYFFAFKKCYRSCEYHSHLVAQTVLRVMFLSVFTQKYRCYTVTCLRAFFRELTAVDACDLHCRQYVPRYTHCRFTRAHGIRLFWLCARFTVHTAFGVGLVLYAI